MLRRLRIGTRGSLLALAQANMVRDQLLAEHPDLHEDCVELVVIKTTGDRVLDKSLANIGGKGLFTKEIEEALLDDGIDVAVHSTKDMPTVLPKGLEMPVFLKREDPRDAMISRYGQMLNDLPEGAVVGTASLRRKAQLLKARPDLQIVLIRGNLDTRIRKVREGEVDATLLALAGLKRLGKVGEASGILEPDIMLPAPAQGVIGLECREGDEAVLEYLAPLNHVETKQAVRAERALLASVDGNCRTPLAALAIVTEDTLHLKARLLSPEGDEMVEEMAKGPLHKIEAIGSGLGKILKEKASSRLLAAIEREML